LLGDSDGPFLDSIPVFWGGPVGTNQLTFSAFKTSAATRSLAIQHHIPVSELADYAIRADVTLRAFIGYAGWSGGQIEEELEEEEGWVIYPADPTLITEVSPDHLWNTVMQRLGPLFRLEAAAPDDPSLN
jgi:putative transcriptional regulator